MTWLKDAMGTEAQQERYNEHIAALAGVSGQLQTLNNLMDRWLPKGVLYSGLKVIDATGKTEESFAHPTRACFVVNTGATAITVFAGRGAGAPVKGVGVHTVAAGTSMAINGTTTTWSFYGAAGTVIDVQIFDYPLAPESSGTGGGGASSGASSNPNTTRVAGVAGVATLLPANTLRKGMLLTNEQASGGPNLYLLYGSGTPSATNYTVNIPAGGYFEMTQLCLAAIQGFWASAAGAAQITELS